MSFGIFSVLVLAISVSGVELSSASDEGFCGPYHIGLLENITVSLTAIRQESLTPKDDNRGEIQKLEGLKNLIEKHDESRGEIQKLGEELKTLLEKHDESRQERISQHEEMMYVFRQILKTIEIKKEEELPEARDCAALFQAGKRNNGVYSIKPTNTNESFNVFCDMEKNGGGWTVIQRRGIFGTPNDYFNKSWTDYKHGFGDLVYEFWLGNDRISALSSQGAFELYLDMWDYQNNYYYASFKTFRVEAETNLYKLHVGDYAGGYGNTFEYSNGMFFTTYDRDNDLHTINCASGTNQGPWWHKRCTLSSFNGIRNPNGNGEIIYYSNTNGDGKLFLSSVVMKIRPTNFLL